MNGHQIVTVTEERDLGVQLTSDMKPSKQCQLAYSTASKGASGKMVVKMTRERECTLFSHLL